MVATLYERIAKQMAEELLREDNGGEASLPEVNLLMKRYRTTKSTIERALLLLKQRQVLEEQQGVLVLTTDPEARRRLREALVLQEATELFRRAREFHLADDRIVGLILMAGGYDGAQG